jgi:hypothetical protein
MVALAIAAVLVAQAPPPRVTLRPLPAQTSCRMIAANGAVLAFDMSVRQQGGRQQIRLTPLSGSVWPTADADFLDPTEFEGSGVAYVVGDGTHAVVLNFDNVYPDHDFVRAELREKRADQIGLTFADGYCSTAPSATPPTPVSNAEAFTDASSWSDHCWVLSRDGRKSAVRYRQDRSTAALTIEALDHTIWTRGAMTVSRTQPPSFQRAGVGTIYGFAIRETPDSLPSLYDIIRYEIEGGRATISLRFDRLNSNAPVGEDAGFGICGLRGLRRAGQ